MAQSSPNHLPQYHRRSLRRLFDCLATVAEVHPPSAADPRISRCGHADIRVEMCVGEWGVCEVFAGKGRSGLALAAACVLRLCWLAAAAFFFTVKKRSQAPPFTHPHPTYPRPTHTHPPTHRVLFPPLLQRWSTLPETDRDATDLLPCLGSLIHAAGPQGYQEWAQPTFQRAAQWGEWHLAAAAAQGRGEPAGEAFDADILVRIRGYRYPLCARFTAL